LAIEETMDPTAFTEAIAVRTLYIIEEGQAPRTITLELAKPAILADSSDYCCPYRIVGLGALKPRYAVGVDALHALQLASKAVEDTVQAYAAARQAKLHWCEDDGTVGALYE
jgi:hypothetical protein